VTFGFMTLTIRGDLENFRELKGLPFQLDLSDKLFYFQQQTGRESL